MQCKCVDPENQGKHACELPEYKGDGNCDDENNNKGCAYDGGDCCAKTVKGGKVKKDYCKKVRCGGLSQLPVISFCYVFIFALQFCSTTDKP